MYDFWGHELKRFYQLETLASATGKLLQDNDRFILPSIQSVMGPAEITALSFELFQEGRYQLIFRLNAMNARKKRASFSFVASKNAEEASAVARNEHRNLRDLHLRAPQAIVQPFKGGAIYLPDRYKRPGHGREIYAYLTQWLHGYDELGINKNLQCIANIPRTHTFTLAETETIKGRIVEILFRTYDPKTRTAMALPEIASGDFVINWSKKEALKIKLIACRSIISKTDPARILEQVLRASWDWNGKRFYLFPAEPETLYLAIIQALGPDQANHAVNRCLEFTKKKSGPSYLNEYLEALGQLVVK